MAGPADRSPDDFVELLVVSRIRLAEVHFVGICRSPGQGPVAFVQIDAGRQVRERRQIGGSLERTVHRLRGRVELCHRFQTENQLHRPQHARSRVHARIDVPPLRVGAYHQGRTAMGVNVVRAVLGVVFQHENCRVLPELAVADRLDHSAQGQVVIGKIGRRRGGPGFVPEV